MYVCACASVCVLVCVFVRYVFLLSFELVCRNTNYRAKFLFRVVLRLDDRALSFRSAGDICLNAVYMGLGMRFRDLCLIMRRIGRSSPGRRLGFGLRASGKAAVAAYCLVGLTGCLVSTWLSDVTDWSIGSAHQDTRQTVLVGLNFSNIYKKADPSCVSHPFRHRHSARVSAWSVKYDRFVRITP